MKRESGNDFIDMRFILFTINYAAVSTLFLMMFVLIKKYCILVHAIRQTILHSRHNCNVYSICFRIAIALLYAFLRPTHFLFIISWFYCKSHSLLSPFFHMHECKQSTKKSKVNNGTFFLNPLDWLISVFGVNIFFPGKSHHIRAVTHGLLRFTLTTRL